MHTVDGNKIVREFCALGLIFFFALLSLSLATYSAQDPTLNQYVAQGHETQNRAGIVGSYLAGLAVDCFGLGAWFLPLVVLAAGVFSFWPGLRPSWYRWLGVFLVFLCFETWASSGWPGSDLSLGDMHSGGLLGNVLYLLGTKYLQEWGTFLICLFVFVAGLQLSLKISWRASSLKIWTGISRCWQNLGKLLVLVKKKNNDQDRARKPDPQAGAGVSRKTTAPGKQKKTATGNSKARPGQAVPSSQRAKAAAGSLKPRSFSDHDFPPLELFQEIPPSETEKSAENLDEIAKKLSECLLDFGVQGEVVNVMPGPVVTMFEFRPAPGVKISRIANLHDDLALALKAMAVRIEAPIPGRDLVGIEIPNKRRKTVYFKEIIESEFFQKDKNRLPMALGSDIEGKPVVEGLAKMPHLLVAGATGAGKSVCLNSILVSLLCKQNPEEMKLLLVDPKRIEMATYSNLPHLVHPVVTEMELAKTALDWALHEMDRRYEAMASLSVRNIQGYNKKLAELQKKKAEGAQELSPLPYLVIVIDELADLILTAGKDAEASIIRLAQLARAAGIHLILATQRPSVDVVTGLIKANFPARIAFQVSSKHDSRTILDTVGAQYLLGLGDMLFKSSAGRMRRIHGAFIDDEDIAAVIEFWKDKHPLKSELDLQEWKQETEIRKSGNQGDDVLNDPLYDQAVEFVLGQGKASISMIQRQLRIGFNRAARFIEQMEQDRIIGQQEGSKPRTVIKE
ncbi:MAG: DNA translocase FtsK 4TM domain-containing protein [Desulfohalobiaceae bacterium]|nr:DNA translocase FtsK 4TM domain-containing protein [Desulfohalobiaceae bacterium]